MPNARADALRKDRRVGGEVRGPKKETAKRDAVLIPLLGDWLDKHVPPERRLSDPDGWLFRNPKALNESGQWSETALRRVWGFACKRVGVQCSLYEGTKHTLGTALKAAGVEDRVIQQLFGHADIRSVQAYARIEDGTLREAMARLHRGASED